jgi:hypothetical protein
MPPVFGLDQDDLSSDTRMGRSAMKANTHPTRRVNEPTSTGALLQQAAATLVGVAQGNTGTPVPHAVAPAAAAAAAAAPTLPRVNVVVPPAPPPSAVVGGHVFAAPPKRATNPSPFLQTEARLKHEILNSLVSSHYTTIQQAAIAGADLKDLALCLPNIDDILNNLLPPKNAVPEVVEKKKAGKTAKKTSDVEWSETRDEDADEEDEQHADSSAKRKQVYTIPNSNIKFSKEDVLKALKDADELYDGRVSPMSLLTILAKDNDLPDNKRGATYRMLIKCREWFPKDKRFAPAS